MVIDLNCNMHLERANKMSLKKEMSSDVVGQMYVARDSDGHADILVWPAGLGIRKRQGCVEFLLGTGLGCAQSRAMLLTEEMCKQLYFDIPKKEEAWLVTPEKNQAVWVRVDEDLELLPMYTN